MQCEFIYRSNTLLLDPEFDNFFTRVRYGQYCAMGLGWVGLDFRGLLPSLFEELVYL